MFEQYESDIKRVSTSKGTLNIHKSINDLSDAFKDEVVKNNLTLKAAFFLYKNHYDHIPVCKICGKSVIFDGKRFHCYCSKECQSKDKESVRQKRIATNLKRYGKKSSVNIEKAKQTLMHHYGAEHPMQSDVVKEKVKTTNIERYGVDNPAKNKDIKEKIAQTNLKRYGNRCSLHCEENELKKKQSLLLKYGNPNFNNTQKREATCLERYGVVSTRQLKENEQRRKATYQKNIDKFKTNNDVTDVKELYEKYKGHWFDTIPIIKFNNRLFVKNSNIHLIEEYCNNSLKNRTSHEEKEIVSFINSIYKGEIIENDYKTISPKELDIFIPEKKVAIEFDGLFWHSEYLDKPKDGHLQKTKLCEQKGIRLIHVFEDEWRDRSEIVKSIIAASLGIYQKRFFARKLKVCKVEFEEAKRFFNDNHIQGYASASLCLGLKDNDELVQCISIGKNRFTKDKKWELIRMASKLNYEVVGGFSKLMSHLKDYGVNEIESYIDRRLFSGAGYKSSGWEMIGESKPRAFYTDFKSRYNRLMFTKQQCLKKWNDVAPDMTEHEMCMQHGLYRIYDCGTLKVKYKQKRQIN